MATTATSPDNDPSISIPWNVQPPSPSAICRIDYPITETPEIFVIPIKILSGGRKPPTAKPVNSQRLRKVAISEYVKKAFKQYEHRYAVQFRAEAAIVDEAGLQETPVDHLLLLKLPSETRDQMSAKIQEQRKGRVRIQTKKVVVETNGTRSNEEIKCIIDTEALVLDGLDHNTAADYWKKLDILLQAFVRNTTFEKATTTKSKGVLIPISSSKTFSRDPGPGDVTETPPVTSTESAPAVANIASIKSASHIQDAIKVDGFLRTLVKLDSNLKKLHLELDLVPGVKANTSLADIVTSVFGRAIQGPSVHHHLPTIRAILIGLEVDRNYTPPAANGLEDTGEVQSSNLNNNAFPQSSPRSGSGASSRKASKPLGELNSSDVNMKRSPTAMTANTGHVQHDDAARSCRYVVSDIQLAGDVPDFVWKDGKRYSVAKYFREKINVKIERHDLPLAKVGNDSWVPLEMLVTHGTQALPTSTLSLGLLNDVLKGDNLQMQQENFADFAASVVTQMGSFESSKDSTIPEGFMKIRVEDGTVVTLLPKDSKPRAHTARDPLPRATGSKVKMGLLYVKAKSTKREDAIDFIEKVAEALCLPGQKHKHHGDQALQILQFDEDSQPRVLTAVVSDVKPLILTDCQQDEAVMAIRDKGLTSILAIIDEKGRSKQEVRAVRAELHKFGNRKAGAATHCMTARTLKALLDRNKNVQNYFPIGTLRHLNGMQGGRNFNVEPFMSLSQNENMMIVGAHVSHPASNASKNCPSVAAVVGSFDAQFTQYPGSARIQSTIRRVQDKQGHLKYHLDPQIQDLQEMMEERIAAWQTKHAGGSPQTIFYRDGMNIMKGQIIDSEVQSIITAEAKAIVKAIEAKAPGVRPSLSYILINKHSVAGDDYGRNVEAYLAEQSITRFSPALDHATKSRYDYHIMPQVENSVQVQVDYAALTEHLNVKYQLSNTAIPAIALPVHYAKKLALRVFDYFHYAITNKYDAVSSVVRRAKYPAAEENLNDDRMVELTRAYLLADDELKDADAKTGDNRSSSKEKETPRANPWPESLDETMFYL